MERRSLRAERPILWESEERGVPRGVREAKEGLADLSLADI
jgi:hypothetical protein